ncbi:MAG: glycosyltransferase [Acidobacteria bacterium]|nr:glycosyltransferase [Acidobacteriota bacterium]
MITPRISVVLAVYNGERHLEDSLGSILNQSVADFEFIIVDDGSTDGTPEILSALSRADPRAMVVRQENRGLAASLNRGIELARGAYVARQDADDISLTDRFERQAAYLDTHPSIAAVGSSADVIDRSGAVVGALTTARGAQAVRRGLLTLRKALVHGSMMMRRDALQAVGGYREAFRVCQDYDLWLRLSSRFEIDNLPDVLYQWRLDRESTYTMQRTTQLQYAGIALAFARERADNGHDSHELLQSCDGDLERFVERYRLGPFVHAMWGELLLRGLGNSAPVRNHLRRAAFGGYLRPWTLCLLGWAHLGLPWPGGRPLVLAEGPERT